MYESRPSAARAELQSERLFLVIIARVHNFNDPARSILEPSRDLGDDERLERLVHRAAESRQIALVRIEESLKPGLQRVYRPKGES
jgi:hypothetical protein